MVAESNVVHARAVKMCNFIRVNLSWNQAVASDEKSQKIGGMTIKMGSRMIHRRF